MAPNLSGVPELLKEDPRWVAWVAVAREGGKVDKIPRKPRRPDEGASPSKPEHWGSFDETVHAYQVHRLSGVGFVLSRVEGVPESKVFAVDLDHCVDSVTGEIAPYAREIVDQLGSYTETSPSGTGLRIFCLGQPPFDVVNNAAGVEVYGGASPRFVTVTGHGSGAIVAPPDDVVRRICEKYKRTGKTDSPTAKSPQPELPDEATCEALGQRARDVLSAKTRGFWESGEVGEEYPSRSELIQASITDLLTQGWTPKDVFTAACTNEHVRGRYLEARQGHAQRAERAIWADIGRAVDYVAAHVQVHENSFEDETVNLAPDAGQAQGEKPKREPNLIFARDARKARRVEWVIKHQIERGYIGELFGPANVGKSAIALDISSRIATGLHYDQHKIMTRGDVVYVAGEGYAGLGRRLEAWALHHGLEPDSVVLTRASVPLSEKRAVSLLLGDMDTLLVEPVLIVVDTLNRNYGPGSENDDETMRAFVQGLERLRDATGAAVMVVHHSGHGSAERSRGHSSFYGALDYSLRVEPDLREPGLIRMSCAKMKDHAYPRDMGFRLKPIALGLTDEDGEVITGVIAESVPIGPRPPKPGKKGEKAALAALGVKEVEDLTHKERVALRAFGDVLTAKGFSPIDCEEAGGSQVIELEDWRAESYAQNIFTGDSENGARNTFGRARKDLMTREWVREGPCKTRYWLTPDGIKALSVLRDGGEP